MTDRHAILAVRVATLAALWAGWEILARSGLLYEGVIPSSFVVLQSIVKQLSTADFYSHLWRTLYEVVVGFAFGTVAAVATGLALGARKFADRMFKAWPRRPRSSFSPS
jgi:NitT/TauT family transport system permease protein